MMSGSGDWEEDDLPDPGDDEPDPSDYEPDYPDPSDYEPDDLDPTDYEPDNPDDYPGDEEDEEDNEGSGFVPLPRDSKIDEAKAFLVDEFFAGSEVRVFYAKQIQVLVEDKWAVKEATGKERDGFYHWITQKALGELAAEGALQSKLMALGKYRPGTSNDSTEDVTGTSIRFYWSPKKRYWRREAKKILGIVREFAAPEFAQGIGNHGETMFDAALPKAGFQWKASNVREWKGKSWQDTKHDLDRVCERDGIEYGLEIKNTLSYIDRRELEIKIEMCKRLGLVPLFIMRASPKSYNHLIIQAGGFVLPFRWQLYPHGTGGFAKRVRAELGLPVSSPKAIEEGTVRRFLKWHKRKYGVDS